MDAPASPHRSKQDFTGILREGLTEYELLRVLQLEKWTWGKWVPPNGRKKGDPPTPDGFVMGDPLRYFTTKHVSKVYLRSLLVAEEMSPPYWFTYDAFASTLLASRSKPKSSKIYPLDHSLLGILKLFLVAHRSFVVFHKI
jgi:hypothetical protein